MSYRGAHSMRHLIFITVGLVLLFDGQATAGTIVEYEFTGTVFDLLERKDVDVLTPGLFFGGAVTVGSTVTGKISWDLAAPAAPVIPTSVRYIHSVPLSGVGIHFEVGGFKFFNDPSKEFRIRVSNDTPTFSPLGISDSFSWDSQSDDLLSADFPLERSHGTFSVRDGATATAFSSVDLPSSLDRSAFDASNIRLIGVIGNDNFHIRARVDTLTEVPEPSSAIGLIGIFLIGAAAGRRRR